MSELRADKVLVELGYVATRSQAKLLIKEGVVYCDGKLVTKPSLPLNGAIEIRKKNIFVGRGAHKLEKALEDFAINPESLIIADIGASTGGFTDVLLSREAKKVYAVDVGHNQLAEKLKKDIRVTNLEGVNIRYGVELGDRVDLCVVDLSYISLKLVLTEIFRLLTNGGKVVALVKPQFEVGKEKIGKNGIVKDAQVRQDCLLDLYNWCKDNCFYVNKVIKSPILGKAGNTEYLFLIITDASDLIESEVFEKMEES